ncbi:heavy metal-responsive transcriptional regulator [Luteimonas sp. MC1828]|uniref:heavy metal-responsive transcriptional regulator n=1 Tax=Luteimonas sp. MC1828 TaxID=2799787 RepID=UPI0018F10D8C|nr:heavy metal-responsive transcriptional regulator [Luteimonas sp. MC1828]MBJ7574178.1 heavy metal-responsive transcriptional regulator [Luteimonas sp. MC1828]
MQIGQLSKRTDTPIDTIRYYERNGVLPAPERQASGYRSFGDDDVARLRFVRRAKGLGFTLREIRDLLALSANRGEDMAAVRHAATLRLSEVERKIDELERIRDGLRALVDACPGHGNVTHCPILSSLSGEHE